LPNKYYRGNYQCDDVILNARDAVWVEKNGTELENYKIGSFTYRLFSKIEGNDITYYLMERDKPFIVMEYSFTRITSPIKGIENKHIWNFKGDNGLARNFFEDYILKRESVIISDENQTEKGFNFWKYLFREQVKDRKTHYMYILDINTGKEIITSNAETQMDDYYTDTRSGKFRFVLQKI
jgi:hypothetical protein